MNRRLKSRFLLAAVLIVVALVGIVGSGYAQGVIRLPRDLPNDNIPTNLLPPTKLAFLQMVESTEVAVLTAIPTAVRDPHRVHPTPRPEPSVLSQIFEEGPVPLSSELYGITNSWSGTVSGNGFQVYAGVKRDQPDLGLLYIVVIPAGQTKTTGHFYQTPIPTGPIRIAAADGPRLTLVSATGTARCVFDVLLSRWVSAVP